MSGNNQFSRRISGVYVSIHEQLNTKDLQQSYVLLGYSDIFATDPVFIAVVRDIRLQVGIVHSQSKSGQSRFGVHSIRQPL